MGDKKIILITGATGFVGSALARFWAKDNELLLLDKNLKALEALQDELNGTPCILPFDFEKAKDEDFLQLAQLIIKNYGSLDILLHLAVPKVKRSNLILSSPQDLERDFKVLVKAPFLLTQSLKEPLLKSSNPKVVFTICEIKGVYWNSFALMQVALNKMIEDLATENSAYEKIAWAKLNTGFVDSPFLSRLFRKDKAEIKKLSECLGLFDEIFNLEAGRLSLIE